MKTSTFTKKNNILAIILNYNNCKDTINLLESLKGIVIDILVIDNCSQISDFNKLQKYFEENNKYFQLIREDTNHGFGGGVNIGITIANENDYDFFVLLNNDLIITDKKCFNLCQNKLNNNQNISCIGIKHFYPNGDLQSLGGGYVNNLIGWGKLEKSNLSNIVSKETGYVMGSFFFCKTSIVDQIGYFDERYFIYFEEADFCLRLKKAGYEIDCIQDSSVIHIGSATYNGMSKGFYQRYSKASTQYVHKWHGVLRACIATGLSAVISIFYKSRRQYLYTILKFSIKGLRND